MLLKPTERGLYCEAGDFYVDPWQAVDYAVITHAHSDHARAGSSCYLAERSGKSILQYRLGPAARIETLAYGESVTRNGVTISLHPAGHILGSAQIRIEHRGEVCVVSGDYKTEADGTCAPFAPLRCHTFVTESTFGLPIYRWRPQSEIFSEINSWWRNNQRQERTSVLFCYSLGKAQRLLCGMDETTGPIWLHGSITPYLEAYEQAGAKFPKWNRVEADNLKKSSPRGIVLAPASTENTPWFRKFGEVATAFASGWMQIRGTRRRRALDRGFVLSDHADWRGLLDSIRATGAENIWVTHGYTGPMVRWLGENGYRAEALRTRFTGEPGEEEKSDIAAEGTVTA